VQWNLDYCNVAVAGLPSCDPDRLQSVINAAARLTADHITALVADLHWLRIPQRIQYKLCVLVYQCVQGSAPSYLQNAICPVESAESRRRLRSASSADLIVPATRSTTMGAGPRLRRRSTARLEQSAGRDPSQPIHGCLQTLTENSLLYSVFLLAFFLITFSPRAVDIVKCP